MLQFTKLDKNVINIKSFFENTNNKVCDNSVGTKFLWRKEYKNEFAIFNDTLILKESCSEYSNAFYYPLGKDIDGAFNEIEDYCKQKNILPKFVWVDDFHSVDICKRFYKTTIDSDRAWCDYIYDAKSFTELIGKKYSGQRNHINKFKKTYPNFVLKEIEKDDIDCIKQMVKDYEEEHDFSSRTAKVEDESIIDFIENMFYLEQSGTMIKVGDKCIAFCIGEVVSDTLIVHVEKALTEYDGVYPFLANSFAKAHLTEKVKYINREEDCGDSGLRTSKLQYHPIEIRNKNTITVNCIFPNNSQPIRLQTERLVLTDVREKDKKQYFELYTDDDLNKFWGYDYREDLKNEKLSEDYFYNFQKKLKEEKQEYSLAILKDDLMIGEIVMHNFDLHGGVEIGFRIAKKFQQKGYAVESANALINYIFYDLALPIVKGKCYKENEKSNNLFVKLGFSKIAEDEMYYHFIKKK